MARRSHLPATLAALALAAAASSAALAQTAPATAAEPAKPEPDWTFTGNVGLYSQYVFRGISQTNEKPAVQGGFDLGHKSGFYVGTWASNISWLSDAVPSVSASMEWDLYGGYKGSLPADFGYDLGALYYYYPGNYTAAPNGYVKPDTTELYAALTWKFLSLKYSYSVNGKTFGLADSRGSSYLDLTASYDVVEKVNDAIGKVTVFGHLGHQWYTGSTAGVDNKNYAYGDWKVGASTEIYGLTVGIYGTGTNAQDAYYTNPYGKNISGSQFVGYIQKTF
jgi:uncharacterized protein (TIGR02001 family)